MHCRAFHGLQGVSGPLRSCSCLSMGAGAALEVRGHAWDACKALCLLARPQVKENKDKIKLNNQLPYLVGNVVEVLEMQPEEDEEEDGAAVDLDSQRRGKCVVLKTSTRQTIFLPVVGLVDADALKPADLVGVNKARARAPLGTPAWAPALAELPCPGMQVVLCRVRMHAWAGFPRGMPGHAGSPVPGAHAQPCAGLCACATCDCGAGTAAVREREERRAEQHVAGASPCRAAAEVSVHGCCLIRTRTSSWTRCRRSTTRA